MKIEFIPLDYDSFDFRGKNYARIIGRDRQGRRVCLIDTCDIYLWAILEKNLKKDKIKNLVKEIEKIKLDAKGRQTKVEKVEIHEKNFLGKPVKALKIFATNYKDLHDIANELVLKGIEKRRGYDLGFVTHYIIEKKIKPLQWQEIEGKALGNEDFPGLDSLDTDISLSLENAKIIEKKDFEPKVLAYDIEADELEIGKGEILMVSLYGNNIQKVITWKKPKKESPLSLKLKNKVEYVEDEAEMIERFVELVKEASPDFLVGYFSDGFDLPYLRSRAEKFNVDLSLGLDNSKPRFYRGAIPTGKISGIIHIDLLRFIQTAYSQYMQSETLSLNEVSKEFLGAEKKEFKFKHSSKIKSDEWENYFKYNLHDSRLAYKLFGKFWPDLLEFTKAIQEPVFDISRAGLSKYVESYILHQLENFNEIPEKRPTHNEIKERRYKGPVEGAFVLEPTPGLYEDIVFFDFTSMHTSIIISMNISGATLIENPKKSEVKEINSIETRDGIFYFEKKPGFIPLILKNIFEKRKKAKAEYKKNPDRIALARSNAFKLLSASVHGYIGFFGARYYSKESSSSILAYVRKFNKNTIKEIENKGYKVLYGDTDSIAFLRGEKSKREVKSLLNELNSNLPGIMELELEDFFKRGLWVTTRGGKIGAKKKYALIDEKGKLKIRGFETVRRDWCSLAREVQNNTIKLILEDGHEKNALEYIKEIIKKLKDRKIPKEKLIIKTQLKKPLQEYKAITPHVVAAKRMKNLEVPISSGNIVEYYIAEIKGKNKKSLVRERVRLPIEKDEYDIEYYLKKQVLPAVENIFQLFKLNIKEIIEGKRQTKLGDF